MEKKKRINEKMRKEFMAGFVAGLVCLGIIAFVLILLYSL